MAPHLRRGEEEGGGWLHTSSHCSSRLSSCLLLSVTVCYLQPLQQVVATAAGVRAQPGVGRQHRAPHRVVRGREGIGQRGVGRVGEPAVHRHERPSDVRGGHLRGKSSQVNKSAPATGKVPTYSQVPTDSISPARPAGRAAARGRRRRRRARRPPKGARRSTCATVTDSNRQ